MPPNFNTGQVISPCSTCKVMDFQPSVTKLSHSPVRSLTKSCTLVLAELSFYHRILSISQPSRMNGAFGCVGRRLKDSALCEISSFLFSCIPSLHKQGALLYLHMYYKYLNANTTCIFANYYLKFIFNGLNKLLLWCFLLLVRH